MIFAITDQSVIHIATMTMLVSAKVAGPILIISLAIGLGISLIQSVTQIQEVTLTFVPKLAGVALVIVLAGNWMLNTLVEFTRQLFDLIPSLIGS
jgi:flagellar biosynthetic protein FliQ